MSTLSRSTLEDGSQVNNITTNYTGCLTDEYGTKYWHQHGKLHRLGGPAIVHADGTTWWYFADKHQRLDGPAYEEASGYYFFAINSFKIKETTRILLIISHKSLAQK
jgi:hypothetical protein